MQVERPAGQHEHRRLPLLDDHRSRDGLAQAQRRGDVRADIPARTLAEGFFALTSSFVITRTILGGVLEAPDELNRTVSDLFELFWSGASPLAARGEAR